MTNDSDETGLLVSIIIIVFGILGGILLATVFEILFDKSRCPACDAKIDKNGNRCPNCHVPLEWG